MFLQCHNLLLIFCVSVFLTCLMPIRTLLWMSAAGGGRPHTLLAVIPRDGRVRSKHAVVSLSLAIVWKHMCCAMSNVMCFIVAASVACFPEMACWSSAACLFFTVQRTSLRSHVILRKSASCRCITQSPFNFGLPGSFSNMRLMDCCHLQWKQFFQVLRKCEAKDLQQHAKSAVTTLVNLFCDISVCEKLAKTSAVPFKTQMNVLVTSNCNMATNSFVGTSSLLLRDFV